jgi:hypothetical protein
MHLNGTFLLIVLHFNSHENASSHTHTQCTLACTYAQLHYIWCACMTYGTKRELWRECTASYLSLFVLGVPVEMLCTMIINTETTETVFRFTPPTQQQERQSET